MCGMMFGITNATGGCACCDVWVLGKGYGDAAAIQSAPLRMRSVACAGMEPAVRKHLVVTMPVAAYHSQVSRDNFNGHEGDRVLRLDAWILVRCDGLATTDPR